MYYIYNTGRLLLGYYDFYKHETSGEDKLDLTPLFTNTSNVDIGASLYARYLDSNPSRVYAYKSQEPIPRDVYVYLWVYIPDMILSHT